MSRYENPAVPQPPQITPGQTISVVPLIPQMPSNVFHAAPPIINPFQPPTPIPGTTDDRRRHSAHRQNERNGGRRVPSTMLSPPAALSLTAESPLPIGINTSRMHRRHPASNVPTSSATVIPNQNSTSIVTILYLPLHVSTITVLTPTV
jgi:hypothetical protein